MKMIAAIFLIPIVFLSCQKDEPATIVGTWQEISSYSRDSSGTFYWSDPLRYPFILTLTNDGKYYGWSCVPAGHGIYNYNYSTRQITFEDLATGNANSIAVSYLDEKYMIFDYAINGIVEYREKYLRK